MSKQSLEEVTSYVAPIRLLLSTTSLVNVWRRAWADLESRLENRAVDLIEVASVGKPISLDERRMHQVFMNPFGNAPDACSDPVTGSIDIVNSDQDLNTISVVDNGPGLPAEVESKYLTLS